MPKYVFVTGGVVSSLGKGIAAASLGLLLKARGLNVSIQKQRRVDYLGRTVQVIPHVTDEIKARIREVAADVDVAIIEIGGTVGDIESLPFLEAVRQMHLELRPGETAFLHLTLVPFVKASREMKTKPTQHSVKE